MPGAASRDTFDISKDYTRVQFVGGPDRRLFDAELNELQQILTYLHKLTVTALGGAAMLPENFIFPLSGSQGNEVVPSGVAYTVLVKGGYIVAGGRVLKVGTPGVHTSLAVYVGADAPNTPAVIYYDVYDVEVDSTVDANLVDPSYSIETAHRIKTQAVLSVAKPATLVGFIASAPAGHIYVPLCQTNNPTAVLTSNDITTYGTWPTLASLSEDLQASQTNLTALEAAIVQAQNDILALQAALAGVSSGLFTLTAQQVFIPWDAGASSFGAVVRNGMGITNAADSGPFGTTTGDAYMRVPIILPFGVTIKKVEIVVGRLITGSSSLGNAKATLFKGPIGGMNPVTVAVNNALAISITGQYNAGYFTLYDDSSGFTTSAVSPEKIWVEATLPGVLFTSNRAALMGVRVTYDSPSASIRF